MINIVEVYQLTVYQLTMAVEDCRYKESENLASDSSMPSLALLILPYSPQSLEAFLR